MAMDDLFKALQMFQSGVQQAAVTSAVNDATAQFNDLNMSLLDEGQKRQGLQQLANETALRLTGAGASGSQIQSAFNAINPQSFGSAEQAQLEGRLSGNEGLDTTATGIIKEREQRAQRADAAQFSRQLQLQDRKFQQEMMLEGMKLQKQRGEIKAPNATELKRADDSRMALQAVADMEKELFVNGTNTFSLVGDNAYTEASRRFEEAFGRLQSGGAISKDEEARFAKLRPRAVDSEKLQRTKIQKLREQLTNVYKNTGVPAYNSARGQTDSLFSQQAASPVETRRLSDGSLVKVQRQPDGSYIEVP